MFLKLFVQLSRKERFSSGTQVRDVLLLLEYLQEHQTIGKVQAFTKRYPYVQKLGHRKFQHLRQLVLEYQ